MRTARNNTTTKLLPRNKNCHEVAQYTRQPSTSSESAKKFCAPLMGSGDHFHPGVNRAPARLTPGCSFDGCRLQLRCSDYTLYRYHHCDHHSYCHRLHHSCRICQLSNCISGHQPSNHFQHVLLSPQLPCRYRWLCKCKPRQSRMSIEQVLVLHFLRYSY